MGKLPQSENGHIDIAHGIAEALARINLSPYESRVLWVIFRQTYGWHKKKDFISRSQFQKITGLDSRNLERTINSLIEKSIIEKENGSVFQFQKDSKKWDLSPSLKTVSIETVSPETLPSPETVAPPSIETVKSPSPETDTKENKETKEKKLTSPHKKTDPRIKIFLEFAYDKTKEFTGTALMIKKTSEPALVKRLLGTINLDRLKDLWTYFIEKDFEDDFLDKMGKTISSFNMRINSLNQNYDGWKQAQDFQRKYGKEM